MSSAWSLSLEEFELVRAKPAVQRLGFAIQLRMYRQHGRFFETAREVLVETIELLAAVLRRPITDVLGYDWEGRSGRRHRDEILKLADAPRLLPEAREGCRMMRKTPTDLPDRRSLGGALAPIGQSTSQISHNKGYGKYMAQYQYVMRFFL
jgi:hypothetical protein